VSVGLSDVIGKCLAGNPGDRYPRPADLAADLRRHLADLPLAGVRNRGLRERWRKWRRRRPYGVALAGMLLAVLTAAVAVALGAATSFRQRVEQARAALNDGQAQMDNGQWEAAVGTLRRGLSVARATPFQGALADELGRRLSVAERAAVAGELHHLAGRVRFLYGGDGLAPGSLGGLEARCRALWENRGRIVERLRPAGGAAGEPSRDDLLDLAIIWADLQVRLAPSAGKGEARARARAVLAEAEALFGPSPVLDEERRFHGGPAGPSSARGTSTPSAWEHYALGRALLRSGNLARAAEELDQAVRLQPQGLWPNFYQGQCEYRRGNYEAAVLASSVCIGAAPGAAGCFYNRALAAEALGRPGQALDDYTRALRLDPTLASAALNRGMLHYRAGRPAEARADLRAARDLGADPAAVSFDLALVHLALGERGAALAELRRALGHDPDQPDARRLHDSLLGRQR
jgi:tetratricopeptide (TPR) repeat protein